MRASPIIRSLRPHHWLKNAFVLAPATFGLRIYDPTSWPSLALAFVAFCLASSGTYLVNDALDRERDRANPRTRKRPVASGELSVKVALALAALLTAVAVGTSFVARCFPALGLYVVVSHLYSAVFKRLPVLDVASLASLYVLRLVGGAEAATVPPSPWLLLCGGLLALFLALGKRLEQENGHYPKSLLRRAVDALSLLAFAAYLGYTLQPATWHTFSPAFVVTVVPAGWGLARYRSLARQGHADPTEALLGDRGLQVAVGVWGGLVAVLAWQAL